MTQEEQYVEMIIQTKEWFDGKKAQLQSVINLNGESKILFKDKEGKEVELPEEHKKGFIYGITLALEMFGDFPISITRESDE
jgi:hypothetical protein